MGINVDRFETKHNDTAIRTGLSACVQLECIYPLFMVPTLDSKPDPKRFDAFDRKLHRVGEFSHYFTLIHFSYNAEMNTKLDVGLWIRDTCESLKEHAGIYGSIGPHKNNGRVGDVYFCLNMDQIYYDRFFPQVDGRCEPYIDEMVIQLLTNAVVTNDMYLSVEKIIFGDYYHHDTDIINNIL